MPQSHPNITALSIDLANDIELIKYFISYITSKEIINEKNQQINNCNQSSIQQLQQQKKKKLNDCWHLKSSKILH